MNKRQKILAQSITMALISAGGGRSSLCRAQHGRLKLP